MQSSDKLLDKNQEAARSLVEKIRLQGDQCKLFCNNFTKGPEDEWSFTYKTPSSCGRCVDAQNLVCMIFGSTGKFNSLPFVKFHGDRQYSFTFDLLKYFAENGYESTVRLIEERKQDEIKKKAETEAEKQRELREKQSIALTERLGDTVISEELRQQIIPYAYSNDGSLVVSGPNVAAVLTSRSDWGSGGGVAYYDQVIVFYGSQKDMKEWQWRDRYSADNDKPWLAVHAIGKVTVSEEDNKIVINVELINNKHNNRIVDYTFDLPEPITTKTLSADEQTAFIVKAEKEIDRVMSEVNRLWECKPKMVSSFPTASGYVSYRQPSIKQKEFRPEIGVAAFVIEEQIDHLVSDPQIRHNLYVLTSGSEKAEFKAEDHGYGREGGAFLSILEVKPEHIVINTKSGKTTITLSQR